MQIPEVEKIPESVEEDIILSSPLPSMHDYQPSVFPEAVEIIVEKPSDTFDTVGPWIQAIPEVEKIPESVEKKSSLPPSTPPMHDFQPSVSEAENDDIFVEMPLDTVVDNTVPSFADKYYEPQNQAIPEIEKSLEFDEGILSPSSPSPPVPEYQSFVPEVENTEIIAEEPVDIVSDNILQALAGRYYGPMTSTIPKVEKNHEFKNEDSIISPLMYDYQTAPEAENTEVIAEQPMVTVAGKNMQISEVEKIPESIHEDSSTTSLSSHAYQPSVFPEAVEVFEVFAEKPLVTVADDITPISEIEKDFEFIDEDIIPFAPSMYQSFAPEVENATPEKPMDTVADNASPIHEFEKDSEFADEGVISSPPMHDYQPSVFPEAGNVEIIAEMPMDTVADN
uniref:Uncharacterized protein n=1 Tax=Panagrolaimus sp. ES5 TaxID=591445 RepID=A0AC34GCX2_9BILA